MMRYSYPSTGLGRLGSVVMIEDRRHEMLTLSTGLGAVTLPDTLLSPGAVITAINEVKQYATHLNNDITAAAPTISASADGQRFKSDWDSFVHRFDDWNRTATAGLIGTVRYVSGGVVSDLRQYAAEYNALEARYQSITGQDPTYNPDPPSSQILPTEAWIGIGIGAGVLTLGFVAWGLSSAAKLKGGLRGRGRR
jgi:hypothetical protein